MIFSPPSDQEFVSNLKKILSSVKVITDSEIQESMKINDFEKLLPFEFSLLSQELSYLSDLFIYSELSSWSGNVRMERFTDGRTENYSNIEMVLQMRRDLGFFNKNSLLKTQQLVNKYRAKNNKYLKGTT